VSTNMGNLEKLGILVIVILVVVVGVVAMTPKSNENLYPEQPPTEGAAPAAEVLEPVTPDAKKDDAWPAGKDGATKPLPAADGAVAADTKPVAAAATAPTTRTIKVQANDSITSIAQRELGNPSRFNEILDANPGLVPSKLKKGMEIKIPVAAPASPVASTAKSTPKSTSGSTLPAANATPLSAVPAPEKSERVYVVKSGDTLSTIAAHELGSKAKWQEIQKANEDVLHGSDKLKVGMKLQIPSANGSTSSPSVASRDPAPVAASPSSSPSATENAPSTAGEREYVVKSGDTLWAIAKSEMGGDSFVKELRAANEDVLKGSDTLKVGMKLKIPAKK